MKIHETRDVVRHTLPYLKGKVLDLGAGRAKYRDILAPHVEQYVTFDQKPAPEIDKTGDILETGYESECFDCIICHQVLEHVPKPWLAVEEMWRILKPEGICVTSVPFLVPFHADPNDYFRYTKEGLKSLFESAHFKTIKCETYGKLGTVLWESLHHTVFSPYKKKKLGADRIRVFLASFGKFIDKVFDVPQIYLSVYIVAQKNCHQKNHHQ